MGCWRIWETSEIYLKNEKIFEILFLFFSSWGNFGGGAGGDFARDNLPFLRK